LQLYQLRDRPTSWQLEPLGPGDEEIASTEALSGTARHLRLSSFTMAGILSAALVVAFAPGFSDQGGMTRCSVGFTCSLWGNPLYFLKTWGMNLDKGQGWQALEPLLSVRPSGV
jgi:hypothetical protein